MGNIVPGAVVPLNDFVVRITAPNPGAMTGPGTNSYIVGREELALIEATRRQTARILRGVPESSLQRSGVHSAAGIVTLADLLTSVTNHLTHHLRHIIEKKQALGLK